MLEPIWFHKTGDNEVPPNRLWHFVVPRFVAPNWFQNPEPFFLKNGLWFQPIYFKKNVFLFNKNSWVCYNYVFSFVTKDLTIQTE